MEREEAIKIICGHIREELYPEVVAAAETALRVIDLDSENFGTYSLGCTFYENQSKRLFKASQRSSFFTGVFHRNVLEISATVEQHTISFFSGRVHGITRIPCSMKSIKSILSLGQDFLSREIKNILDSCSVYILGSDIDPVRGVGKTTFDQLFPMGKRHFEAKTLATFGAKEVQQFPVTIQLEQLKKPIVRRETGEQEMGRQV